VFWFGGSGLLILPHLSCVLIELIDTNDCVSGWLFE